MAIILTSELHTLFEKAAGFIVEKAKEAIDKKGSFYWALSGGKTPNELFALLATEPFRNRIDWENTFIFWGDERYVAMDHEDNNSRSAKEALLQQVPLPSENIFPIPVHLPLPEAAAVYESAIIKNLGNNPVFDLVMLGLGNDGHTASLFPGSAGLMINDKWVIAVDDEGLDPKRISFTFRLINNAATVMFLVTGKNKTEVIRKIMMPDAELMVFPAQKIKPHHGEIYWFLDNDAMPDYENIQPSKNAES